jgi:cytochrome c oxidase cbb3-type subunit 2
MNHGSLVFLGILATLSASWLGLVAYPARQLAALQPHVSTNDVGLVVRYPARPPGEAAQGRDLYVSLGCVSCHSQQVRPESGGSDLARGWGRRRTVARDYVYQVPVQLGETRLGPDLANYGERLGTNSFPLVRLYNPRLVVTNSTCVALPFFFRKHEIRGVGSSEAIPIKGSPLGANFELLPKAEALQLAAYLQSLSTSVDLPEAALPVVEEGGSK